jgi:hypothetical protein
MPCNCGGSSSKQEYVFVDPKSGRQHTYKTMIEAQAAQVRAGGGGNIRTVSK